MERIPAGSARPAPGLTSDDVVALTGVTYRQLDYWVRRGFIPAPGTATGRTGSGHGRRWTLDDVDRVARIARHLAEGLTLPAAAARAAMAADPVPAR